VGDGQRKYKCSKRRLIEAVVLNPPHRDREFETDNPELLAGLETGSVECLNMAWNQNLLHS
jgi:hypothetical protein